MNSNATAFTPGVSGYQRQPATPPAEHSGGNDYMSLENQFAALQMSAMQSTPSVAASYGATQGQPQPHSGPAYGQRGGSANDQANQQAVANFLRQRQAQQQQHQFYQQQQRNEAAARTAQASPHQLSLLAQIQAEYTNKMAEQQQQMEQQQRSAAQSSGQNSVRNRQAQSVYAHYLREHEQGRLDPRLLQGRDLMQFALDTVDEQMQRNELAATQEQIRQVQMQQQYLQLQQLQQQELQQQALQIAAAQRAAAAQNGFPSPAAGPQPGLQQDRRGNASQPRERTASSADAAVSWRTRMTSSPATVIDTNELDESPRSSRSFNSSADETPQTSEDDVHLVHSPIDAIKSNKGRQNGIISPALSKILPPQSQTNSRLPSPAPRLFSGVRGRDSPQSGSALTPTQTSAQPAGPRIIMMPASRQPKGPPTEVGATNFATRMNARTRKDALSRLKSASPRVSSGGSAKVTVAS